jgi:type VI secretion system protein ImpM
VPDGAVSDTLCADVLASLTQPPGWFGKVSMLGDFAHRRLAPAVVRQLDAWLSASLVESRSALGARWLDAYLRAPVWAFAWSADVVDDAPWAGVWMPSVDAAGRYFPLVVAARVQAAARDVALLETSVWPSWYGWLERCAVSTLDDDASVEAFEARLHAPRHAQDHMASTATHASWMRGALSQVWLSHGCASSAWWPLSAAGVEAGVEAGDETGLETDLDTNVDGVDEAAAFITQGLPSPVSMTSMISGSSS